MFYRKLRVIILLTTFIFVLGAGSSQDRFAKLRKIMVETQIEERGVKDPRVLLALEKVPRHKFVPSQFQGIAYTDTPLPIGKSQTISQPFIVGLMTELLKLKPQDKVLEIGTGSGYQAAILAELAKEVYTIEIIEPLANRARDLLQSLGYKNIKIKCGDGFLGWLEFAPFDAIIVTCAAKIVPQPLIEQLAEGGRLVIPVGEKLQELKLIKKEKGESVTEDIIPVRFVPMTGMIEDIE